MNIKSLAICWNFSCGCTILSLTIEVKFMIVSVLTSAAKLSFLTRVTWLFKKWTISEFCVCNLSKVSWSWMISEIVAVPNNDFNILPPIFTSPRLRSSRGKIWWNLSSFNSNCCSNVSIWRSSEVGVNFCLYRSTSSKSSLTVDITSWYVLVLTWIAIRQAWFVKTISVSFTNITQLFRGCTNGSNVL